MLRKMCAAVPWPVPSLALGYAGREGAASAGLALPPAPARRPHVPSPISSAGLGAERSSSEGLRAWPWPWPRCRRLQCCSWPACGCTGAVPRRPAAAGTARVPASLRPYVPCVPLPQSRAADPEPGHAFGWKSPLLAGAAGGARPSRDPPPDTLRALGCALTLLCLRGRPGYASCALCRMGTSQLCQPCRAPHGDTMALPCTPWQCPGHATCVLHPMGTSWPCQLRLGPRGDVLAVPATSHAPWGQTGCTLHPVGTPWPCRPCPVHGAPWGQPSRASHPSAVPAGRRAALGAVNSAAVAEGTCCQGDPLAARDGAEGGGGDMAGASAMVGAGGCTHPRGPCCGPQRTRGPKGCGGHGVPLPHAQP
ncbi:translation initiation factor IF-2-like [Cygnus olor]|uniref:translation initiation factor IF-2-like n=1 Tax=Cygnus olor TaxID=8869 RepID=UPI001ADE3348|nr:translation initiation factor IF-2-like [Cygnus olor]